MKPRPEPGARTLRDTGEFCAGFLRAHAAAAWERSAPDMDWTTRQVLAHIANTLLWYAYDLAAGDTELSTTDITVRDDAEPSELVRTVSASVRLLAAMVEVSGPGRRGWHPRGRADASGFAAMACDELLVHTDDVARAAGVNLEPPPELAEATLRRLFPWAPDDGEPWPNLLWANGRIALPGRPRLETWTWHCAPLSEWDPSGTGGA